MRDKDSQQNLDVLIDKFQNKLGHVKKNSYSFL